MEATKPLGYYNSLLIDTAPSLRYNGRESFFIWQEKARAKLDELLKINHEPCDDEFTVEYVQEGDGFTETRFTFQSEPGWTVPCHMLVPSGTAAPMPVMICLQGHSTGMHISLGRTKFDGDEESVSGGDRDFALQAVKRGYIAIAMEQRGFGECGGDPKPACYVPSMAALLAGKTLLGGRVRDVSALIDIIEKYVTSADCERISCMGNSGGGTTTIYSACLDERIKSAMPSCATCTYEKSIGAMHHCACNFVPDIAEYFDMGDLLGLIAPRKIVIVSGKDDKIFPLDGAKECVDLARQLYFYAGKSDNVAWVVGEGGHRFYADKAWAKFESMHVQPNDI